MLLLDGKQINFKEMTMLAKTKQVKTKCISAASFRKTILQGAKVILSDRNSFKGTTKEISGRKLPLVSA